MAVLQTQVGPHPDADQLVARRRDLVAQALIDPAAEVAILPPTYHPQHTDLKVGSPG